MSDSATRLTHASDSPPHEGKQSDTKVNTACNSLLETAKSTYDPLKQTFSSKGDAIHHVSEAVNALASLQGAPSQLLDSGIAQIPLLDKMPGMPAAVIGAAHLGTPHAHDHPPSDGFPLPSIGATIGSGCLSVLIGGLPAARVTDIGIAPTCGGMTPYFDIQTGSSNTFIGGMRAARMGIDMTRHCNPMGHAGKSSREAEGAAAKGGEIATEAADVSSRARGMGRAGMAWKAGNAAIGPGSGVAGAADDLSQGEAAAAAMMSAQTAADMAMMLLGSLMGKDPGIEPSMGMLLNGNDTVLIGGFPIPDSQMMWHGAKHGLGKKIKARGAARQKAAAPCRNGHPVDVVKGTAENEFVDYAHAVAPVFSWERYYCSGWRNQDGALGFGFRHNFQHELRLFRTRALYVDPLNREYQFPRNETGRYEGSFAGYRLEQGNVCRFVLWHEVAGKLEFQRRDEKDRIARLVRQIKNGVESEFHYDAADALTGISQTDERNCVRHLIHFAYDSLRRIVEVLMTRRDGARHSIARYTYTDAGCLATSTGPLNAAMSYGYDERKRMIRETDRNGFAFGYRYDSENRCIETVAQDGMWRVTFDYCPGRTIATHADGGTWTYFYDESKTVNRIVDPYGNALARVVGEDGSIVLEVDAVGRELQWVYDDNGRSIGRIDRWGNCWPPNSQTPVRNRPNRYALPATPLEQQWGGVDRHLLLESLLLPTGVARYAASLFGQERPEAKQMEERDAAGRVVARKDAAGRVEHLVRDAEGNVVCKRDREGGEYHYAITSWNLCESACDPLGKLIRYRYTNKAEISAIIDPAGNESGYDYDLRGRLVRVRRHGVVRETYTYDGGDRLVEKCGADGEWLLRFEIGDNGLPSKRALKSGETHHYQYDTQGNFTNASTDRFHVMLDWDANGRIVSDRRDGLGVEHKYANKKRSNTTWFERFAVSYEPSGQGETVIRTPAGGIHRISRASDGSVLVQLGNGTNMLRRFDADGRCEGRIAWRDDQPEHFQAAQYIYSATGELRAIASTSGGVIEYRYDAAHRLIGEWRSGYPTRQFAYDCAGNLISTPECASIRYLEGNRLAGASSARFRYDDRNHLAEQLDGNGCRTTYSYNSMGLLTVVERSDRAEVWTADYDGLCRRIYQGLGAARTLYYWDQDRLAAEIYPDGRVRFYVYADESALVPFMFIDYASIEAKPQDGNAYFVVTNQVGMPEWIEGVGGDVVWRAQSIDPYGWIDVAPGNSITYDLRFAGHHFDPATQLHYNRFRTYCPVLRRYLQSDPVGQSGGVNLYAYTANPLVQVDVLGLSTCEPAASNETGGPEGHAVESAGEPEVVEKGPDGKYRPTGARYPKRLIHVPDAERPAFEKARDDADQMRADFEKALNGLHLVTVLPFVFRKKDGSYHVGVAASKDWETIKKDLPKVAAVADAANIPEAHRVVGADEIPVDTSYPRVSAYNYETATDHHAEQRALRWADAQPDIDGCAYLAPTEPVCEGCMQAIYNRIPADSNRKAKFDPDDPDTRVIAKPAQGGDFYTKKNLPRGRIVGVKPGAIDDAFAGQSGDNKMPKDAKLQQVARKWKVPKKMVTRWVQQEGAVREAAAQQPGKNKMPSEEALKKIAKKWEVEEKNLASWVKKFLRQQKGPQ